MSAHLRRGLSAAGLLGAVACGGEPAGLSDTPPWFEDRAAEAGLAFEHVSGAAGEYLFPEIMGGGVALFDYDADGDTDVYLVQSGDLRGTGRAANRLFANDSDLRFRDVTEESGTGDTGYGMGVVVGDVDGDDWLDLVVTNVGPDRLYRSRGDGSFADATAESGLGGGGWSTSAAFLDHDSDGDLDLFVTSYIVWSPALERPCLSGAGARVYCSPSSYESPAPDTLYENDGAGRLTDVSARAGLHAVYGNGLGVTCGDFDGDGRIDVYVANDGNPNQLWHNRGDGTFTNVARQRSCAVNDVGRPEAGMGVQAVDLDADDDLDLFVTHLRHQTNTFYRNAGEWFEDATGALGLGAPSYAFTGFGVGFHDFDHDGYLDVYVANGRVIRWEPPLDPTDVHAEPDQLFAGTPEGSFREVWPPGGVSPSLCRTGRGAAFGDLDGDGDVDAVVVNRDAPATLLVNVARKRGAWVAFRVLDEHGRSALYARVVVHAGGRRLARRVERAYGYCSSSSPEVHFGLGEAQGVDRVEVHWADGGVARLGPLPAGRVHELRRGSQGR